jgi:2-(1,2-epoxy-1,2-dihydrophenyl)acetyl-CoA isomerase
MQVSDADGVRTVTFDRPEVMNAMNLEVARDLAAAVEEPTPDEFDAIVLTGEGEAFSAGGDIQAMAEREETTYDAYRRVLETFTRLAESMLDSPVPIVAKVDGDAVGAGLALVAASDFAYAAESARFSAAFVKVGLIPDTGATLLLPKLVGLRAAKELVFTGDLYDAGEAAEMGLVNEVVRDGDLDDAVDELVETLSHRPTRTIGLAKQAMHATMGMGVAEGLDYEALIQSEAYSTPDHLEGVSAFLEGRKPDFE